MTRDVHVLRVPRLWLLEFANHSLRIFILQGVLSVGLVLYVLIILVVLNGALLAFSYRLRLLKNKRAARLVNCRRLCSRRLRVPLSLAIIQLAVAPPAVVRLTLRHQFIFIFNLQETAGISFELCTLGAISLISLIELRVAQVMLCLVHILAGLLVLDGAACVKHRVHCEIFVAMSASIMLHIRLLGLIEIMDSTWSLLLAELRQSTVAGLGQQLCLLPETLLRFDCFLHLSLIIVLYDVPEQSLVLGHLHLVAADGIGRLVSVNVELLRVERSSSDVVVAGWRGRQLIGCLFCSHWAEHSVVGSDGREFFELRVLLGHVAVVDECCSAVWIGKVCTMRDVVCDGRVLLLH